MPFLHYEPLALLLSNIYVVSMLSEDDDSSVTCRTTIYPYKNALRRISLLPHSSISVLIFQVQWEKLV